VWFVTTTVKGLRERNKEDKLERIEKAARLLFAKQGYERTTTREIAELAGIGTGTLFVYFPEKRDLLFHLFSAHIRKMQKVAFDTLPDGTLVDRVMHVFSTAFEWYAHDLELSQVYVKEMGFIPKPDRERIPSTQLGLEFMGAIAGLVAEAQRAGEVDRAVFPLSAAHTLFSLYLASLISWLGGTIPSRENQLAMLRSTIELLYRGLAPRPAQGGTS
jgi:TetR/AcrR family transcriptional regulator, cholesterol catabolism regulator